MTIIFARHGQSEANVLGIISNRDLPHALTELGRAQATQLMQALAGERIARIAHIYTSPILRARQTAEIVATALGYPVDAADTLREFDCGIAEGRGDAEAWHLHHDVIAAWRERADFNARIAGGESFNDLRARFMPFVAQLQTRHANEAVLCISHGSMLGLMLPAVLANVSPSWADAHPIGNCATIRAEQRDGQLICTAWCDAPV
jgi:probable phosphoglycerate mutase